MGQGMGTGVGMGLRDGATGMPQVLTASIRAILPLGCRSSSGSSRKGAGGRMGDGQICGFQDIRALQK